MIQIPEGLQMGSIYAVGEHTIPAGIEFIFDTSVLPICHPFGALDMHPLWVYQSTPHLLSRFRLYSCPFVTLQEGGLSEGVNDERGSLPSPFLF